MILMEKGQQLNKQLNASGEKDVRSDTPSDTRMDCLMMGPDKRKQNVLVLTLCQPFLLPL